jgi:hypothetical protein
MLRIMLSESRMIRERKFKNNFNILRPSKEKIGEKEI